MACLGVLVVVVSIEGKSAPSTVAPAILAFSIQLIVFVAQESVTAEQGRDLAASGLVELYPPDRQPDVGFPLFRLTDRGRDMARPLTAVGEPPDHLPGLGKIRQGIPDKLSLVGTRT